LVVERGSDVAGNIAHVAELLWEANGAQGHFIVRASPLGQQGVDGVTSVGVTKRWLNLLRRDTRWVVEVRRYEDDPFGAAACVETVESKQKARERGDRLTCDIRAGHLAL
jgi:hypothetical protein